MFPARFSSGFSGRGARDADFRQGELAQQGGSGMGLKGYGTYRKFSRVMASTSHSSDGASSYLPRQLR